MTRVTLEHVEARRHSILHAAQMVFARKGIQGATMAEIAEAAGISAGAIYRYFPSKDDLAAACFQETAEKMAAEWHRQVEGATDPLAVFYDLSRASFDEMNMPGAADSTRIMVENILDATRSPDPTVVAGVRSERETIVSALADVLEHASEQGSLPRELSSYQLAHALLSFYMGARLARLVDDSIDTDAQLAQVRVLMDLAARR